MTKPMADWDFNDIKQCVEAVPNVPADIATIVAGEVMALIVLRGPQGDLVKPIAEAIRKYMP